jgi:hypothetical protein
LIFSYFAIFAVCVKSGVADCGEIWYFGGGVTQGWTEDWSVVVKRYVNVTAASWRPGARAANICEPQEELSEPIFRVCKKFGGISSI